MPRYIKVDKDQPQDPRLLKLAGYLYEQGLRLCRKRPGGELEELPEPVTRNALSRMGHGVTLALWCYADTYLLSDNTLPVTRDELAPVLGLPGDMLALWPKTWLIVRDDGTLELPRYVAKNHIIARDLRAATREQNRIRQQRHRAKKRQAGDERPVTRDTKRDTSKQQALHNASTGTYKPIPVEKGREALRPPSQEAGSLASALGRLARRPENGAGAKNGNGNGNGNGHANTEELRADARKLAKAGMPAEEVVRLLGRQGIEADTVRGWLAEEKAT